MLNNEPNRKFRLNKKTIIHLGNNTSAYRIGGIGMIDMMPVPSSARFSCGEPKCVTLTTPREERRYTGR